MKICTNCASLHFAKIYLPCIDLSVKFFFLSNPDSVLNKGLKITKNFLINHNATTLVHSELVRKSF